MRRGPGFPGQKSALGRLATILLVCIGAAAAIGVGVVVGARYIADLGAPFTDTPGPTLTRSPSCSVATPAGRLRLDLAQAANAVTIAAVGRQMGVVDGAVTVAYVASLQESKLRNLPYGDLDSLGLFQQRPSQGWGTPAQLVDPRYAASAFYRALMKVPGWEAMPVGDAAQAVQRSNGPDAYASWEHQGRMLAEALTGQDGAAFTCQYEAAAPGAEGAPLDEGVAAELGRGALDSAVAAPQGWATAAWLVGHAHDYAITAVTFLGQRWTSASGKWERAVPVDSAVHFERARPPGQP